METGRGDAAAATWIFLGDGSRRRRGRDVDIPRRTGARLRYPSNETCVAAAIEAGTDQNCGSFYGEFGMAAFEQGLVTTERLTTALARILLMRFRLGEFDPPSGQRYLRIPPGTSNSSASADSALRAARESVVLLNNSAKTLPLDVSGEEKLKVALIGPFSELTSELMGQKTDYTPYTIVSFAEGLRARAELTLTVETGCAGVACPYDEANFTRAVAAAAAADVTVVALGIDRTIEGEAHDRTNTTLPGSQLELLQQAMAAGASKVVVVLANGGPLAVDWVKRNCPTVLEAFLGGQSAGTALADVLLGDYSPSGALPFTMHEPRVDIITRRRRREDVVTPPRRRRRYPEAFVEQNAMTDFRMRPADGTTGRTYRFYEGSVLWPFGFGLSYTTFGFAWAGGEAAVNATTNSLLPTATTPGVELSLRVTNTGGVGSAKVVLFFVARVDGGDAATRIDGDAPTRIGDGDDAPPRKTLVAIEKIFLEPNASTMISVTSGAGTELGYCAFCAVAADGKHRRIEAGIYEVSVGDGASHAMPPRRVVVIGDAVVLPL